MVYNKTLLTEPVKLSYRQEGSGTALLLLHGFPLDHTMWEAQCNDLRSTCRVIMPDLRGHGKSPAPEGAYSMVVMAEDVLNMLNTIGVYKAIWVGHSMGGYVVQAAYRLAPERFSGIGFIASNHRADTPEAQAKRYELAEKVAKVEQNQVLANQGIGGLATGLTQTGALAKTRARYYRRSRASLAFARASPPNEQKETHGFPP